MQHAQRHVFLDQVRAVRRLNVSRDVIFVDRQNDERSTQLLSPNSLAHMRVFHAAPSLRCFVSSNFDASQILISIPGPNPAFQLQSYNAWVGPGRLSPRPNPEEIYR